MVFLGHGRSRQMLCILVLVVTLALRGCVGEVWVEEVVSGSDGSAMVLCRLVEHICDGRG